MQVVLSPFNWWPKIKRKQTRLLLTKSVGDVLLYAGSTLLYIHSNIAWTSWRFKPPVKNCEFNSLFGLVSRKSSKNRVTSPFCWWIQTGPFWWESTGDQWISQQRASYAESVSMSWRRRYQHFWGCRNLTPAEFMGSHRSSLVVIVVVRVWEFLCEDIHEI